jgi:hypothetical protein
MSARPSSRRKNIGGSAQKAESLVGVHKPGPEIGIDAVPRVHGGQVNACLAEISCCISCCFSCGISCCFSRTLGVRRTWRAQSTNPGSRSRPHRRNRRLKLGSV